MNKFQRYEELIDEFSYKSYTYAGDVIQLSVQDETGNMPAFVMKSPALENNLNQEQKEELNQIMSKAMIEIMKFKPEEQSVKKLLGWN